MKKVMITVLFFIAGAAAAPCQYWKALGKGPQSPFSIQTLYGDSVSDRLLAGGPFTYFYNDNDTVIANGQVAWNGVVWDSVAHRIQDGVQFGSQQTHWFLRFQGALYACGGFVFPIGPNDFNNSIAKLNESTQSWEDLGCLNSYMDGMNTLVPKEPTNTLYATGHTGSICGYPQSCVFRYDGSAFYSWEPYDEVPYHPNNSVGTVFDYQGMTYMTGNFLDPLGSSNYRSLIRHNGNSWEYVPGWNTSGPVKEILIRNNILFVSGAFYENAGGPGNLIAAFDGNSWNNMGGGLQYTNNPSAAAALDLEWFHSELYACGLFNSCGGVLCDGIAKWTGTQWCGLPGQFSGLNSDITTLSDMTVWRDSLFVCGGISYVDGAPFNRTVAQWIGGDAVAYCSEPVGVGENNIQGSAQFELIPNPSSSTISVAGLPENARTVEVRDVVGRIAIRVALQDQQLDISSLATGTYLITVFTDRNIPLGTARFMKE